MSAELHFWRSPLGKKKGTAGVAGKVMLGVSWDVKTVKHSKFMAQDTKKRNYGSHCETLKRLTDMRSISYAQQHTNDRDSAV